MPWDLGVGKFHARYDRELERERRGNGYGRAVLERAAKVLLGEHVLRVLRAQTPQAVVPCEGSKINLKN